MSGVGSTTPFLWGHVARLVPNNVVGVYNVLEAARLAGARRLVLASSGQVVWNQRLTDDDRRTLQQVADVRHHPPQRIDGQQTGAQASSLA